MEILIIGYRRIIILMQTKALISIYLFYLFVLIVVFRFVLFIPTVYPIPF